MKLATFIKHCQLSLHVAGGHTAPSLRTPVLLVSPSSCQKNTEQCPVIIKAHFKRGKKFISQKYVPPICYRGVLRRHIEVKYRPALPACAAYSSGSPGLTTQAAAVPGRLLSTILQCLYRSSQPLHHELCCNPAEVNLHSYLQVDISIEHKTLENVQIQEIS